MLLVKIHDTVRATDRVETTVSSPRPFLTVTWRHTYIPSTYTYTHSNPAVSSVPSLERRYATRSDLDRIGLLGLTICLVSTTPNVIAELP